MRNFGHLVCGDIVRVKQGSEEVIGYYLEVISEDGMHLIRIDNEDVVVHTSNFELSDIGDNRYMPEWLTRFFLNRNKTRQG